jgi:hypothetical protein
VFVELRQKARPVDVSCSVSPLPLGSAYFAGHGHTHRVAKETLERRETELKVGRLPSPTAAHWLSQTHFSVFEHGESEYERHNPTHSASSHSVHQRRWPILAGNAPLKATANTFGTYVNWADLGRARVMPNHEAIALTGLGLTNGSALVIRRG